ncbi:unnamed protein product [Lepidochelys kempii]
MILLYSVKEEKTFLRKESVSIDESWMVSSVPAILIGRVFHISQQQIEIRDRRRQYQMSRMVKSGVKESRGATLMIRRAEEGQIDDPKAEACIPKDELKRGARERR